MVTNLQLSTNGKVYDTVTVRNGEKTCQLVFLKQKSVGWMKNLIDKGSRPGELVTGLFKGTFATAKACLELPRDRYVVG